MRKKLVIGAALFLLAVSGGFALRHHDAAQQAAKVGAPVVKAQICPDNLMSCQ